MKSKELILIILLKASFIRARININSPQKAIAYLTHNCIPTRQPSYLARRRALLVPVG